MRPKKPPKPTRLEGLHLQAVYPLHAAAAILGVDWRTLRDDIREDQRMSRKYAKWKYQHWYVLGQDLWDLIYRTGKDDHPNPGGPKRKEVLPDETSDEAD
jgi:hypothetical protein